MLYRFKSDATADLIMLEPNARRLLQILGKETEGEPAAQGIILPEQMSQAMADVERAIALEEAQREAARQAAQAAGREAPGRGEAISLRQRAQPFLDMLRRSHKAKKEIVWGV